MEYSLEKEIQLESPLSMELQTKIYYCSNCNTPLIINDIDEEYCRCNICSNDLKYISTDIRPVFPEERLLVEILLEKPLEYIEKDIWAVNNRYFVEGKVVTIDSSYYTKFTTEYIKSQLDKYSKENNYKYFNKYISKFLSINRNRLNLLVEEASNFIKEEAEKFPRENIILSFSGGKDSTVVTDLVKRSLQDPSMVHIFGDTTLEFPMTLDYVDRYRKENTKAIFKTARNNDQSFMDMCEDIGPPARMLRWCCSMFKTGPITRTINGFYRNSRVLTFYGIRKHESVSRSKYNRVEGDSESVKIQQQTVAAPIFEWKDIDVWLYILSSDIDFNNAYRLGYDRVGCWCCPNNNLRSQFLSQIYMSDKSKMWRDFLIKFAKSIGKPDPEEYIDSGNWKARQGGNGLRSAKDVKVKSQSCTTEENAYIYKLNKPIEDDFYELFYPFGTISPELGRKLVKEKVYVDRKTKIPILSIQPYLFGEDEYSVKIKTMNTNDDDDLQRMLAYQIKKYNACRNCLKCESVCPHGAITIKGNEYHINPIKCTGCRRCVTAKYIDGGCLMEKYLKTKD